VDANIPNPFPVGVEASYFCTNESLAVNGILYNMCDEQGIYLTPPPTCEVGKSLKILQVFKIFFHTL